MFDSDNRFKCVIRPNDDTKRFGRKIPLMEEQHYQDYLDLFSEYDDVFRDLFNLNTLNLDEINQIYKNIKEKYLETKKILPFRMLLLIQDYAIHRNRFFKSYFEIFKNIASDFHITANYLIRSLFNYFYYKETGILITERDKKFDNYEKQNLSLEVHAQNTIYRAIMDDDIISFIPFTEKEGFDPDQELRSDFYPCSLDLNELCCYHGAVKCFKFLITKFNPKITHTYVPWLFIFGWKCRDH